MSDMNGNPHYEHIKQWDGKAMNEAEVGLMAAHATLTLAWEQRTANLLHAFEISLRAQSAGFNVDAKAIDARLGFNEGAAK